MATETAYPPISDHFALFVKTLYKTKSPPVTCTMETYDTCEPASSIKVAADITGSGHRFPRHVCSSSSNKSGRYTYPVTCVRNTDVTSAYREQM